MDFFDVILLIYNLYTYNIKQLKLTYRPLSYLYYILNTTVSIFTKNVFLLGYYSIRNFCLKLRISITTDPIGFFFLGKLQASRWFSDGFRLIYFQI